MFKGCEPIRLQFLFDMSVDVVQHLFYVLNGLVDRLLLRHHFLLPASTHQGSLLNQPHHFLLLLATRYNLLLALRVLEDELAGANLHFVAGGRHFLAFLFIRVVVVFYEQVDASF